MNVKHMIKILADIFAESIYLVKNKRKVKTGTVYCNCGGIDIPENLKAVKTPVNAQYILTDIPLPDRFIKKAGQTVVVICGFERARLFGRGQHLILMADYIVCDKNKSAVQLLEKFEINGLFKGKTISGYDKDLLKNVINGRYAGSEYKKSKNNVLIYSGSLAQNGLTASLVNVLSFLDNEGDTEYIITYREDSLKNTDDGLGRIPERFCKLPMPGRFIPSVSELICYVMYFKLNISAGFVSKRIEKMFKREWQRFFGMVDIDTAVQFTGYEYGVINLFGNFQGKKVIFVHNDMVSEIKYRHNQHYLTLRNAYRNFDVTAIVTEDMRKSTLEISGREDNMKVVPNCHNYKAVCEKAGMPVEFQDDTECNVPFEKLIEILDSDTEKFITIGRFSPEKAHMRLIDAFESYCKQYPDNKPCLIIIGGRGELYGQTVEYAEKTGLDIIVIRSMMNPMPVLKKCSLFMLPSEYEGLGLVLLEADTLGVPVFATDISGPSCFLKEYGGCLVENSFDGIVNGMKLYRQGGIKPMNINFKEYNKKSVEIFQKTVSPEPINQYWTGCTKPIGGNLSEERFSPEPPSKDF